MKLWVIPWAWDYHQAAELVVMATSKEVAVKKAQKWYLNDMESYRRSTRPGASTEEILRDAGAPKWDKVELYEGAVYENGGCDC